MTADAVGGVWTYALDLGSELVSRGWAIHLATMGPLPDGSRRAAAEDAGLHLHPAEFALEWTPDPWTEVAAAGEWLLGLAREIAPHAVHLNGFVHAGLPWPVRPVVVAHSDVLSWHRHVRREEAGTEWSRYAREVANGLRAAGRVVAVSRAVAEDLRREYGYDGAEVIPNFRRAGLYAPAAKEPFALAVGRMWDEAKNAAALERVARRLPLPVRRVGDGSPEGRATEGELAALYARAAIFVHPARYEPFGLAVLEAALSGCALVLGDIPSLRENWDGAALFAPPDDPDALVAAVEQASARTGELGAAALARAERFDVASGADSYERLYEATCASKGGEPPAY